MVVRVLSLEEKHTASLHLLHAWHMFAWVASNASKLPESGTPGQERAMYGTTAAVFIRRLVSFYFPPRQPPPRNRENEIHAGRFVPGWYREKPPKLRAAVDYASHFVVHLTERHLAYRDRLPVPEGGAWLAALAPFHSDWLRQVVKETPGDLDPAWNDNMRCFTVTSNPQRIRSDGSSQFQTDLLGLEFSTPAGLVVPDPPAFLADFVKRSSPITVP